MKFTSLLITGFFTLALMSCNNGGGNQQGTTPVSQDQNVTAVQPQAAPDSNQAQPAQAQALPDAITQFINKHFPGATVAMVETDNEHGGIEYDVTLNDGTEVDFDNNNQWDMVESRTKAIPAALIPAEISSYVKSNYQSLTIVKIDKQQGRGGYEVELSNGIDLHFDANGKFLRAEADN